MEIIKPGSLDKMNNVIVFTCRNCGCVFKAGCGDYTHDFSPREGVGWYDVKCPFCHEKVTMSDKEVKEQWDEY